MIPIRFYLTTTILVFVLLPSAVSAQLSGDYKSQKWPGSKIVFFEDGTAWYTPPRDPNSRVAPQAYKLRYRVTKVELDGKLHPVLAIDLPDGTFMGFQIKDGDLIRLHGDYDRFVKETFWKKITE
jgi:hypothetical protein